MLSKQGETIMKDTLSNVVAIISVVAGAINAYLQSTTGDINYYQLGLAILLAVISYLTGKKQDLSGEA